MAVFAIRDEEKSGGGSSAWVRAGTAFVNKDSSLNIYLDALPLNGKLHVREVGEKKETVPLPSDPPFRPERFGSEMALDSAAAGVHG